MGGPGFEEHFDRHAERYERARPHYPAALWRTLRELGALRPGARALDLGAGTGQATRPLVEAGLAVTAVEPGPALAARLAERVPGATVVNARAEDASLDSGTFDVVTAATAIHWFDLGVLLPRLHDALVAGGLLLVWRNVYGDPSAAVTPFRRRVQAIVDRRKAPPRPGPGELEVERWSRELTAGGLFRVELVDAFRWSAQLDSAQVLDLFTTFSDWTAEEAGEAAAAVDDLGGRVTEHYVTWLIALRRADLPD